MATLSCEPWRQLTRAGRILGLVLPLFVTAGPVSAGMSPRCECDATVKVSLTTRMDAARRALQRIERFLLQVQEGRFERALDHLVEKNPDHAQSSVIKQLLRTAFWAHRRLHGPYIDFNRTGMQEIGPYVVRANYMLHSESAGVPTTFVMSRVCDDWALEFFCIEGDWENDLARCD